jgi:Ala-tRNA(Pro) deacylase
MSTAYHQLVEFICTSNVPFRLLGHPPCRTSQESAAARAAAGVPGSAGAKALIIKSAEPTGFMMAVLPGTARLCNDRVRELVGKFHFANPLEIAEVAGGLSPGMIPPFTRPLFPGLQVLLVDERIGREPLIGFNAAHLERSIVLSGSDYMSLADPTVVTRLTGDETL